MPGRNLQQVEKKTIYDNTRVLYQKSILGYLFEVSLKTQCDLLIYSYDVKVNCVGTVFAKFLGTQRTVKVFDFTKSVSFAWSHSETYSGNWGKSIWIGLPKPVKFIGITLTVELYYRIDLVLTGSVYDPNPYTYQVKADIDAKVETDSSASVRVGVFEAGVYLKGDLVKVETDPVARAKFLFAAKEIEFKAIWNAKLSYFKA